MKKLVALLFVFSLLASPLSFAGQAGNFSAFGSCDVLNAEEKAEEKAADAAEDGKKKKKEGEPDCE